MIPSLRPNSRRVVIVGGGIAGLSVAHALLGRGARARGIEVVVLERAARAGGNIRTEHVDGYACEWGPNGFLDNAPATLDLVRALGLQDRLQPSNDAARRRFIFRNGRLHPLPGGVWDFLSSGVLSWPAKLRLALEPAARGRPDEDETIHAFAARRIGDEAADVLVDAMVSGVFGGDARALSLRACFPKMWQMETDHGGLFRALLARRSAWPRRGGAAIGSPLGRLTSFAGGSEELVRALAASLADAVRTGVDVHEVQHTTRGYRVKVRDGAPIDADVVVLGGGAAATARMVRTLDDGLADTLAGIPSAPMVVACLGFRTERLPAPLDGFGFLVPRTEGLRTLGVLWDSSIFPSRAPGGHALMRVMIGGATDPAAVELDDRQVLAVVEQDLGTTMGIAVPPEFVRIVRHRGGIPQYTVGHLERLARAERQLARWPGLELAGNGYRGVAINACVADAGPTATRVLAHCERIAA